MFEYLLFPHFLFQLLWRPQMFWSSCSKAGTFAGRVGAASSLWVGLYKSRSGSPGWLGSRVASVLDSGAEGPGFKSQSRRCRVTVLGKLFTLVAALLRVAKVTMGLTESNGSLSSGLWLISPAGWLPRTGISTGTLHSVIEYGPLLPFSGSPKIRPM